MAKRNLTARQVRYLFATGRLRASGKGKDRKVTYSREGGPRRPSKAERDATRAARIAAGRQVAQHNSAASLFRIAARYHGGVAAVREQRRASRAGTARARELRREAQMAVKRGFATDADVEFRRLARFDSGRSGASNGTREWVNGRLQLNRTDRVALGNNQQSRFAHTDKGRKFNAAAADWMSKNPGKNAADFRDYFKAQRRAAAQATRKKQRRASL